MSTISFSLADLFEKEFSITNPITFPPLAVSTQDPHIDSGNGRSVLYKKDLYGRDYFMPVQLGLTSQPANIPGFGTSPSVKLSDGLIELPYPVMRLETRKNFIETPLTERTGTVKELINIEDYRITIRGFMINKDGSWPEAFYTSLNNLYRIQAPLIIRSALTDLFLITTDRGGNDAVVITDLRFPEARGSINVQPYEMTLVSDHVFSLYEV